MTTSLKVLTTVLLVAGIWAQTYTPAPTPTPTPTPNPTPDPTPTPAQCATWAASPGELFTTLGPQTIESLHPYCPNVNIRQYYSFNSTAFSYLQFDFDPRTVLGLGDLVTLRFFDPVRGKWDDEQIQYEKPGSEDRPQSFVTSAKEFYLEFSADLRNEDWGYGITVTPVDPCGVSSIQPTVTLPDSTPIRIDSPHFYCPYLNIQQEYLFTDPNIQQLIFQFDPMSILEEHDKLVIDCVGATSRTTRKVFTKSKFVDFTLPCTAFSLAFTTDQKEENWGYRFTVIPELAPTTNPPPTTPPTTTPTPSPTIEDAATDRVLGLFPVAE